MPATPALLFESFAASVKRRAVSRPRRFDVVFVVLVVLNHEMLLTLLFAFTQSEHSSLTQMEMRKDGWRQN